MRCGQRRRVVGRGAKMADDPHVVEQRQQARPASAAIAASTSGRVAGRGGAASRRRIAAHPARPLQAEPERERRRQQEVGVPERVLEQAVQRDHQHHHEGGALHRRIAGAPRARPCGRRARRNARRSAHAQQQSQHEQRRAARRARPASCSGRLWVWSKKAIGRSGNGVSVQAKLNSPKPTPVHGCARISASVFDQIAKRELETSPLRLKRASPPKTCVAASRPQPPCRARSARRSAAPATSSHAGVARQAAVEQRPTAPAAPMPSAPVRERAEHDDEQQQQRQPAAGAARERPRLAEPDRRDDRPTAAGCSGGWAGAGCRPRGPEALGAIQSPSASRGANTWIRPIAQLPTPATTRPMQNARNAGAARHAAPTRAGGAPASAAATIRPADDSASDHGSAGPQRAPERRQHQDGERRRSSARAPRERGRAFCASPTPSNEQEAAPADQRGGLVEEGRRRREVEGDQRRKGDRQAGQQGQGGGRQIG